VGFFALVVIGMTKSWFEPSDCRMGFYNAHALLRFGHRCSVVTAVTGGHHCSQMVADQLYSLILTAVIGVSEPIGDFNADLRFTVAIGRASWLSEPS
jgi:hypothetical protein